MVRARFKGRIRVRFRVLIKGYFGFVLVLGTLPLQHAVVWGRSDW